MMRLDFSLKSGRSDHWLLPAEITFYTRSYQVLVRVVEIQVNVPGAVLLLIVYSS